MKINVYKWRGVFSMLPLFSDDLKIRGDLHVLQKRYISALGAFRKQLHRLFCALVVISWCLPGLDS